jgi:hypothetical protein
MTTFKLTKQVKSESGIVKYFYKSDDMLVVFYSHPTKAFNYVCDYASSNMTNKIFSNVIDSFINQGISQHDYEGGFNEAISVLTF